MNVRSFGVAAVFLVGCAVGGVSSQLVVPKAHAEQDAALTKWEYKCVAAQDHHVIETLNPLGAEGWEISTVRERGTFDGGDLYCLKRPKM